MFVVIDVANGTLYIDSVTQATVYPLNNSNSLFPRFGIGYHSPEMYKEMQEMVLKSQILFWGEDPQTPHFIMSSSSLLWKKSQITLP